MTKDIGDTAKELFAKSFQASTASADEKVNANKWEDEIKRVRKKSTTLQKALSNPWTTWSPDMIYVGILWRMSISTKLLLQKSLQNMRGTFLTKMLTTLGRNMPLNHRTGKGNSSNDQSLSSAMHCLKFIQKGMR